MKVSTTISLEFETKQKLAQLRKMPTPQINEKIESLIIETAKKFKVK